MENCPILEDAYVIAVDRLRILHYAINANNFEFWLKIGKKQWKDALVWTKLIVWVLELIIPSIQKS